MRFLPGESCRFCKYIHDLLTHKNGLLQLVISALMKISEHKLNVWFSVNEDKSCLN